MTNPLLFFRRPLGKLLIFSIVHVLLFCETLNSPGLKLCLQLNVDMAFFLYGAMTSPSQSFKLLKLNMKSPSAGAGALKKIRVARSRHKKQR